MKEVSLPRQLGVSDFPLFWASVHGDLHEVERLLAQRASINNGYADGCQPDLTPARAAAGRGHTAVAITLLASCGDHLPEEGRPIIRVINEHVLDVLEIARQRNNVAMAVAIISALDIASYLEYRSCLRYDDDSVLSACAKDTPELFKAVLSTMSSRLRKDGGGGGGERK